MFSSLSNLEKAKKNHRIFRWLTGISVSDFQNLIPLFSLCVEQFLLEKRAQKQELWHVYERALGGWPKWLLATTEEQLFFILAYVRLYLTFEMMGFFWNGTSKWRTHDWVMQYLPILESALWKKQVLPKRKIGNIEDFIREFPDLKEFFLDGSERRIQRPKKGKIQEKYYSGKKKTHTVKNGVIGDKKKRILFLSETVEWKKHDSPILEEMWLECLSHVKHMLGFGDTAFVKFKEILTPKKATKLHPLTSEEKEMNRQISQIRVKIEHTFSYSGWKRFCMVRDPLRSRIYGNFQTVEMNFKDMVGIVAAWLHNLALG